MATTTYTIGAPIVPPVGAIAISLVFQTRVPCNGGYRLDLQGVFPMGYRLNVHVGPTGSVLDAKCFSGKAGQSTVIYAVDAEHLHCYTPRLPAGGPFAITVRSLESDGGSATLPGVLSTIRQDFRTSVFSLRSMFPSVFLVGVRKIEDVPPIE